MKRPSSMRSRPRAAMARRRVPDPPAGRMQVAYIVISSLVICSLLAVAVASIDFAGLFGDDSDSANYVDPNASIVKEQETVVAENPDDVDELVFLANLYGNTGRINEAVPLYERAMRLAPDDLSIRLDFAQSLAGADLAKDAEAQFRAVLEVAPDNQTAHYYLAELYREWEPPRLDEAIPHYRRVIEIDSSTFMATLAEEQLTTLAAGTPVAGSPAPEGTP